MGLSPGALRTRVRSACMERLDRLGWAAGLAFDAYGVRFGVRVSKAEVLDHVTTLLPPGWRPAPSPIVDRLYSLWLGDLNGRVRKFHLLYAGICRRARTLDLDMAFDTLEADLRQAAATHARRHVFVHAGVVGWRGQAILLPGRSGSGKSTLVRELVRAGAVYYSDEFAVIDSAGRVHPFAKPLALREGKRTRKCSVEELGGVKGKRSLVASAVIFTEHRAGARWRPVRQTAARGLLALLGHAVPVRRRPHSTLAALEKLVSRTVIVKSTRGEAEPMARAILESVARWERGASARPRRGQNHESSGS
jgi:hypothetical protein